MSSKRSARHVARRIQHAASHWPRSEQARQLLELKAVLRRYGFPTKYALALHREGMGPEELASRARFARGAVGSLEYTHNIRRR